MRFLKIGWVPAFAGMTTMLAATAAAQPATAPVDYAKPANWLCLPGRADTCSRPPAATWLHAGGYGDAIPNVVAKDPPIDCFYVYPTVSLDRGLNSDLIIGEEKFMSGKMQPQVTKRLISFLADGIAQEFSSDQKTGLLDFIFRDEAPQFG